MQIPRFGKKSIPIVFFILTVLTYGLMLPWTGFYWDDWPFAWIAKFLGSAEFIPAFAPFRPFLGPIFFGTTSLLPPNPLYWQSLALILRFALAITTWWAFKTIWPHAKWQALSAALLFLVFPGYSQHWVALTHINQEWIPFLFYLLSFGCTALALRQPDHFKRNTLLALLFLIPGVFPTEYFATQEPLRFLFILVLITDHKSLTMIFKSFRKAFKLWLPYLLVWLVNAGWLLYYYKFGTYASYGITINAKFSVAGFLIAMGDALWKVGLYSWVQVLVLAARSLGNPSTLLSLATIVISFIPVAFYLHWLNTGISKSPVSRNGLLRLHSTSSGSDGWAVGGVDARKISSWGWQAVVIGLIGILLGRIPSWAAGLPLTLQSINDRFMVSMMIGGSLFVAGLLELIVGHRPLKVYALALLLALGIGQQFYTANDFRRDWARQQEIFWQMVWRIPGLEPGTVILTHELPLRYETDMGLTAPLNWIYAPNYAGGDLFFALLYTRTRLEGATLPALAPGQPVSFEYRTVFFKGSTSQALTILVPPNACLRVLDPIYAGGDTYERQPRFLRDAISLSNPALIRTNVQSPEMPVSLFGKEPSHDWCYYYEKAELARQASDWKTVAALGNEARASEFMPGDALEWLPFIEGYARTGDYESARGLSLLAYQDDSRPRKGLCYAWERIQADGGGTEAIEKLSNEMLEAFACIP